MKKLFLKGIVLSSLLVMMSCNEKKDPVQYNNEIVTVINGSDKHMTDMNSAMQSKDYDKAEKVRVEWEKAIDQDIKKMEDIGDFNGDAQLQNAVLNGLKGYKKIVADDYPKLIDLRKKNTQDPAAEQLLLNNINNAFENMAENVNQASDKFERDYNK